MWEWLLTPIDPGRAHEVSFALSWHARAMVLAWGVLAPLCVLTARYLKVLPWQNWPSELDNQLWWRTHWIGQSLVLLLTLFAFGLIYPGAGPGSWHGWLGYAVLGLALIQALMGAFRGTKGGPTAPALDGSLNGDHYDMTLWRLMFEHVHKTLGYILLTLATLTILLGLWHANAPRWMWIILAIWWTVLIIFAIVLQKRGWAIDTYQAIWGPGYEHPGNRRPATGWGMRRLDERGNCHVRSR